MLKKSFSFLLFTFAFLLLSSSAKAALIESRLDISPFPIYKDTTSITSLTATCTAFSSRKGPQVRVIYPDSTEDLVVPQNNNQIILNTSKVQGQMGQPGTYTFTFKDTNTVGTQTTLCRVQFSVSSLTSAQTGAQNPPAAAAAAAINCAGKPDTLPTAIGCIPTKPENFAAWFLGWAIGIAGGIAFLLMIWGAAQVILSSGDPEKLENGKGIITNALAGLLFIIFAIVILRLIGYNILQIPGFQ